MFEKIYCWLHKYFGKTYYISIKGSDNNSGLSEVNAFGSFDYAFSKMSRLDVLIICKGEYVPRVNYPKSW